MARDPKAMEPGTLGKAAAPGNGRGPVSPLTLGLVVFAVLAGAVLIGLAVSG